MKKRICAVAVALALYLPFPNTAKADIWGADVAVLSQILLQSISQLAQLRSILSTGHDTLDFMHDINRGINDSLAIAETLGLRIDPGLYREIHRLDEGLRLVESLFGKTADSPLAVVQRNTDKTVAEAISFNNELNDYALKLDKIGEEIKSYSHAVSPAGAAKLTAESMGVMIHVMNQQLRASGEGLKLQAQALALQNKQEKDKTAEYLKEGQALKIKMETIDVTFNLPRF